MPSVVVAQHLTRAVLMDKDYLILKRASASRSSGEWNDDDFDVLADSTVVGASLKRTRRPVAVLGQLIVATLEPGVERQGDIKCRNFSCC